MKARTETQAAYKVDRPNEDQIIQQALDILAARAKQGDNLSSPQVVRDWLRLKLGGVEHEEFAVIFLNSQNEVIEFEIMFRGTLTQTSVYPREVVKAALHHNSAAVILAHNHPSGTTEPSQADRWLTDQLKAALGLVDVKVIDHFIVTADSYLSFAERGFV
jgi:DNA repair protein RadC